MTTPSASSTLVGIRNSSKPTIRPPTLSTTFQIFCSVPSGPSTTVQTSTSCPLAETRVSPFSPSDPSGRSGIESVFSATTSGQRPTVAR